MSVPAPAQPQQPQQPQIPKFAISPADLMPIFGGDVTPQQAAAMETLFNKAVHHSLVMADRLVGVAEKGLLDKFAPVEAYMSEGQERRFWNSFVKAHPEMEPHLDYIRSMNFQLPDDAKTPAAILPLIYQQAATQLSAINPALQFKAADNSGGAPTPVTTPAAPATPPNAGPKPSVPLPAHTPATKPPVAPTAPSAPVDPTAPREISAAEIFALA